jgi:microcystin degradation protein MlrC
LLHLKPWFAKNLFQSMKKTILLVFLFFPIFALFAFTGYSQEMLPGELRETAANLDGQDEKKVRIAIASFSHETCTFCPTPTGIAEWEYYGPPQRGNEVLNSGDYIRGFVSRCDEYGGIDLIGIYSPREAKGGSSGSWITREAFEKYSKGMAEGLANAGKLDGLFLSLHGAMAVTGIPKPEAELVRRLRKVVGDIPIVVTLDLHANEDHELSDAADAVFITKRYPHYDAGMQGERAARILIRTIRGTYQPVMATRKPGVITPSVFQWTGENPAMEIMERARRWEARVPDLFVSVAFGFAYADVPDVGATVMVVANNDQETADRVADDMNDYIWRVRESFAGKKLPKTEEGVTMAIQAAIKGKTPVIIGDHSDRSGNATHILEELIEQKGRNFCIATLSDSLAINGLISKGLHTGDKVQIRVGGYGDAYAGNPVQVEGTLSYLEKYNRFQRVAVIHFPENNWLILTPLLHQVTSTRIFEPLGINLEELDIIVLKSRVHFRRGYYENGFAKTIILIDAPGMGPADLTTLEYKNIPDNLYPLNQ